jgi:hypothetical protein
MIGLLVTFTASERPKHQRDGVQKPTSTTDHAIKEQMCDENTKCLYESYLSKCVKQASVNITHVTIEGGAIRITAQTVLENGECVIKVTYDSSGDQFSDGKINTYTCKNLVQESNQRLIAEECTGTTDATSILL